ncbi:Myc-type, basic helix-loop-helix (bHLH) domain [Cinara cedri]|uniref:Myc-type, basic helix-loop-helix (BHLH) domain n=1 Tax=Cinara cedri TaxID=506608 RepID=A0A5E4MDV0_9HEMI|nr:Myc-type, basic helix-loop-helix (bHLH) domain [Cinara cedri]
MCLTTGVDEMDENISSTSCSKKTGGKLIEPRKIRKPMMEKKRRARINQSLDELKRIVVQAEKCSGQDMTRANKLEKADILELTVRYLKRKSTVPPTTTTTNPPEVADVYLAGYKRCLGQVRELLAEQWTDEQRRLSGCRMVEHLEACVQRLDLPPPSLAPRDPRLSTSSDEFCHLESPVAASTATTTDDDDYDEEERRPPPTTPPVNTAATAAVVATRTTEFRDVAQKATWRPW